MSSSKIEMSTKIFINLPVKDLKKSKAFFKRVGFSFHEAFTDENAACMMISENIFTMLLTHTRFKEFTRKQIPDGSLFSEVINCISAESKEKVNEIVDNAMAAGGKEFRQSQDYGFIFGRSFNDLDGHTWEVMWMDETLSTEGNNNLQPV